MGRIKVLLWFCPNAACEREGKFGRIAGLLPASGALEAEMWGFCKILKAIFRLAALHISFLFQYRSKNHHMCLVLAA
jgi:hypothetical protein